MVGLGNGEGVVEEEGKGGVILGMMGLEVILLFEEELLFKKEVFWLIVI